MANSMLINRLNFPNKINYVLLIICELNKGRQLHEKDDLLWCEKQHDWRYRIIEIIVLSYVFEVQIDNVSLCYII